MSKEKDPSPMMKHYRQLKQSYPDCIVFYRLGDFYEMFDEDAIVGAKELDLTLTGKNCGEPNRAPMCGVPYHAYETYARRLVEKGYNVAICEQLSEPGKSKLVERDVVRVITKGTLTDASMLDESSNNYIMSIFSNGKTYAYAYTDISTGVFKAGSASDVAQLNDHITRINPAEIICNEDMYDHKSDLQCTVASDKIAIKKYYEWAFQTASATKAIVEHYKISSVNGYDFSKDDNVVIAVGSLLQYLLDTQKRQLKNLSLPILENPHDVMYLDSNTRRNLEIEENARDRDRKGSLLWVLDETKTSMGKRNLKSWLREPLQSVEKIKNRQDKVESLFLNGLTRQMLDMELGDIADIERLVGRVTYGTISPKDCIALANSLARTPKLKNLIANYPAFSDLNERLCDCSEISNYIYSVIKADPSFTVGDGNVICEGVNAELDRYRNMSKHSKEYITQIEAREKEETGIKGLKIKYNKVYGYYIEVSKQYMSQVPYRYMHKQTVSNNERYFTEELKNLEEELLSSDDKIQRLESAIYQQVKERLTDYTQTMLACAKAIAELDCYNSLAKVASENNYVRPLVDSSKTIQITGGRHPVVEKGIKRGSFVPNDCHLNDSDDKIMIITGPNMAGKSTFMRQNALIVFMAHIGSFVPAISAQIGIVDRIFTRIGATDDLMYGQSTFMVEMVEVANILTNATDSSLILLDEVGRGTSTFDGLSIAWAMVDHLAKNSKAKTLFATHYHELTELEGKLAGVKNYRVVIKEIAGELVFVRKVERGGAMRSFGIEVASLAGLPNQIIDKAKEILVKLENQDIKLQRQEYQQTAQEDKIRTIVKQIDFNNITPMKAMETIEYLISLTKE